ncbi:FemAB family XrtA/PEP-CTERM system-associated protein [Trichloromonas acetexigens]|jgi:FemAB-related protein (PEP-CTERM system-associated)|uniref:FemAB family PEP-CTERM system-associated protein n=1 Tax=Trichloromonas acetexigens TaxID=38815 RepID=A0A550JJJ0_9BACT|nr:FemAB family XrtA/PEP-CTERM system-associated protein [Desulfuromonas acetexigens]TRO83348.1 FemAB family PEP-CTERM system-associated protein [Desulfuromonas acetexigens]
MNIRLATDADRHIWDAYVLNHPDGSLFHLDRWRQAIDRAFGHPSHALIAEERGGVVGLLPLGEINSRFFGHYLVSAPFAELGGPLADTPETAVKLLEKAAEIGRERNCAYVELKNRQPLDGLPTKDLYVNFSKAILPEVEANLAAIPRKSRAAVRKGIDEGLTAAFGHDQFDAFYEVMAQSYHQLGTPIFAKGFFRAFLEVFGDDVEVMVVRERTGVPVACVLTFYFKDRVMPYYAGSLWEYRRLCPNDFKYWELMKRACERGCKVFDYGRSKIDTGSFSFKKHWGFEPTPLAYQYQLINADEMPNLSPTNPKYQRKIELWRKMPLALSKLVGPPLAKYLA